MSLYSPNEWHLSHTYSLVTRSVYYKLKREGKIPKKLSYSDFKKIVITYNRNLVNEVIETGEVVELPRNCGWVYIVMKPTKIYKLLFDVKTEQFVMVDNLRMIDIKNTEKHKKIVYYLNLHTGGKKAIYGYSSCSSKIFMPCYWVMRMAAYAKQELHKRLISEPEKYTNLYVEKK